MWLWIFLTLFFLISVVTSTLLYYSLKRINQYEQLLVNIETIINYSSERLKAIDTKGAFESDDEIGYFFNEVKKLQAMMNDIFENEETSEGDDKDE